MPKEVFRNAKGDEHSEVRWYNFPDGKTGSHIPPVVAVGVGQEKDFELDGMSYSTMYFNFETPEQVEDYIKALRRAKKKVFG